MIKKTRRDAPSGGALGARPGGRKRDGVRQEAKAEAVKTVGATTQPKGGTLQVRYGENRHREGYTVGYDAFAKISAVALPDL